MEQNLKFDSACPPISSGANAWLPLEARLGELKSGGFSPGIGPGLEYLWQSEPWSTALHFHSSRSAEQLWYNNKGFNHVMHLQLQGMLVQ
jgi:hypothetical protein